VRQPVRLEPAKFGAVSELETIGHHLRGLSDGLDRANQAAAAAGQRAEEITARAAALGMMGVAIGVQGVQQQIAEIQQRLATVGRSISAALGLLASVPPQSSPDQVIQVLSPASEQVGSASTGLNGAAHQVDQVQQLVLAILAGGAPGPLVQSLGHVKQLALELAQQCAGVRQTIDQAIQQARLTGRSGN
jgi:hypothetical protein